MFELANAPVSWGVDFPDQPGAPPWEAVLDGIAGAGYQKVELGPYGFLPTDPSELSEALVSRDLAAAGGLLYEPFHDPRSHDDIRSLAERVAKWIRSVEGEYLLLVPVVTGEREKWAGRADQAPALDDDAARLMSRFIDELVALAAENGLTPAIHPHAGTYLETREEFERLMTLVGDDRLRLCVDTGHCLYAGIEPVSFVDDYVEILAGFHVKDLDRARLADALERDLGFDAAVAEQVFVPLGSGDVDFRGLADVLQRHQVQSWATVEQDIDPRRPGHPEADAAASRQFLENYELVRGAAA